MMNLISILCSYILNKRKINFKRILRRLTERNAEVARGVLTTSVAQEATTRVEQNPRSGFCVG